MQHTYVCFPPLLQDATHRRWDKMLHQCCHKLRKQLSNGSTFYVLSAGGAHISWGLRVLGWLRVRGYLFERCVFGCGSHSNNLTSGQPCFLKSTTTTLVLSYRLIAYGKYKYQHMMAADT